MNPTIQNAIEEVLPYTDPAFVGPIDPAGVWPVLSRLISPFSLPPSFANFMDYIVVVFFDHSLFPHSITQTSVNAGHIVRQQSLRQIVLHVMAANDLDVLIYPHHTVPVNILFASSPITIDSRPTGGYNALTDVSGLPDLVIPGGFTTKVYNVVSCATPGSI